MFRHYTSCFGRTGCSNFTTNAKTKGSKKHDRGCNGNLNGESAKETMLSEMRVSGLDRLLPLVVILYTSAGYSECQRSACGTSAGQSAVYLQSAKNNNYCNSFSLRKGGKARWYLVFSESSTNDDR